MKKEPIDPLRLLRNSRRICGPAEIAAALEKLATRIEAEFAGHPMLFLAVMKGAMFPGSRLAEMMNLPLRLDYVHASRYLGNTSGGEIQWLAPPTWPLKDEHILIFDDIFDEGHTLEAIRQYCVDQGAARVRTAVLVRKIHQRGLPRDTVDYVGMDIPDEYVFGCGMDVYEFWRQLNELRVLEDT